MFFRVNTSAAQTHVLHRSTKLTSTLYSSARNQTLDCGDHSYNSALPAAFASSSQFRGKVKRSSGDNRKKRSERNPSVDRVLLKQYAGCGDLENAVIVFAKMRQREVSSWNVMVRAHAREGQCHVSLKLFDRMLHEGVIPDRITISCILSACSSEAALVEGKKIHTRIWNGNFQSDVIVGAALINMYGKCGDLIESSNIFDQLPQRDVVAWNTMITVYGQHQKSKDAFRRFDQMQLLGLTPNEVTFISLLDVCATHLVLFEGKRLHAQIVESGFELDVSVGTVLVSMYNRCSSPEDAIKVFNTMRKRDVVAWTTIITLHAQNGKIEEALLLLHQMQRVVEPNKVTCITIITACANHCALVAGRKVHTYIVDKEFLSDVLIGNALVNMYGKCGSMEDACMVFNTMPKRNRTSWTAMVTAYAQHGWAREAIQLFGQMEQEGVQPNQLTFVSILDACSRLALLTEGRWVHECILKMGIMQDVVLSNALVSMYGKCGSVDAARVVFENMSVLDVVSWTAMIAVYALHGQAKEALQVFEQMQREGVAPDKVTLMHMLDCCAREGALAEGKRMHFLLLDCGFQSDMAVETALINMYSKCSSMENARWVFDRMPKWDVIPWNAIITSYSQHGLAMEALQLFNQMLRTEVKPNKATFIGVLVACSCSGLVDKACHYFMSMNKEHGFAPGGGHYDCMIDLIGRAGLLDEAEKMIDDMPFQPTVVSYMALLSACRCKVDVERGERAARHALELNLQDSNSYVLLSNIYGLAGCMEDDARS